MGGKRPCLLQTDLPDHFLEFAQIFRPSVPDGQQSEHRKKPPSLKVYILIVQTAAGLLVKRKQRLCQPGHAAPAQRVSGLLHLAAELPPVLSDLLFSRPIHPGSLLHCAHHDALGKIFLQERVHEQDRNCRHNDCRVTYRSAHRFHVPCRHACRHGGSIVCHQDLSQNNLQRVHGPIREDRRSPEPTVPDAHAVVEYHDCQHCPRQGQDHGKQDLPVTCPVYSGRLTQGFRNTLKRGPQNDHIVRADHKGKDQSPVGVCQMEILQCLIKGDHAARYEHGHGDQDHDRLLPEHALPG